MIIQIDIGIAVGVIGVLFAIFGYFLNRDRDKKADATASAEVKVTLNHISQNVHDVKDELKSFKDQLNSVNKDLVRLDEGLKNVERATEVAHERINQMKNKVGGAT